MTALANRWRNNRRACVLTVSSDRKSSLPISPFDCPWLIPRNHRVEAALAAATDGDLAPFESLLAALRQPFDERPEHAVYAEPAPAEAQAGYQTFCGT